MVILKIPKAQVIALNRFLRTMLANLKKYVLEKNTHLKYHLKYIYFLLVLTISFVIQRFLDR